MQNTVKISEDLYYIGVSDMRIALFENVYPVPGGVSYNSYLLKDEKTVLFDTVDAGESRSFFENLEGALGERPLDYLIVQHMEPDHSAWIRETVRRYPNVKLVVNSKTVPMLQEYFDFDVEGRAVVVKEGEALHTGRHELTFVMAPMVHWPEVMMTYDKTDKVLFSADAFGTFGALNGDIFAESRCFKREILSEARRYYTNIVGKFGLQVQAVLKKAANLELNTVCPLHGFVWRENFSEIREKYRQWSTYTEEEQGVLIVYASVYGHTENAARVLANKLAERGVKHAVYDISKTHSSYLIAEAFRFSSAVFASVTYNGGVFPIMENFLRELVAHNIQNRKFGFLENGTWAPMSAKTMKSILESAKNCTFLAPVVTLRGALKEDNLTALDALSDALK